MYIIVKGASQEHSRLRGKNITEFAKNMESEGWPTEFANEEERSKVEFMERKAGAPLSKLKPVIDGRPPLVKSLPTFVKK